MNTATDWINKIAGSYGADVCVEDIGNQFVNKRFSITPTHSKDLAIYLFLNDKREISSFDTSRFRFGRFNLAEGFNEDNFKDATERFLKNNLEIKRSILGREYVELHYGKLIAYGRTAFLKK